jgi:hypothetical protein
MCIRVPNARRPSLTDLQCPAWLLTPYLLTNDHGMRQLASRILFDGVDLLAH